MKNKKILDVIQTMPAADRQALLAFIEHRDRELREQLIREVQEKILRGKLIVPTRKKEPV